MNAEKLIDEVVSYMAFSDPFNFIFLMKTFRNASTSCPTMGVSVKNGRFYLTYNLDFMAKLTKPMLRYVLAHEVGHIALHHCDHRSSGDPKRHELENIAQDLAINTLLPDTSAMHPPRHAEDVYDPMTGKLVAKKDDRMGMFPEDFGFPSRLSYEQYMALLEDKYKDQPPPKRGEGANGDGIPGVGGFDSHEGFANDADAAAMVKAIVERIERNNNWGTGAGNFRESVLKAQETEVPWWQYMAYVVGDFISMEKEPTRRKPNRRLGYPFYGETYLYIGEVDVYIDTSGSVGSDNLAHFAAELDKLNDYLPINLWMFDDVIQNPDSPVHYHNSRIEEIVFDGRGGTNFQAAINHAESRHSRYVIIMTDGICKEPTVPDGMELLWVITPGHEGIVDGWPGKAVYMQNTY
jgi:predicted metal-dependent peptidase